MVTIKVKEDFVLDKTSFNSFNDLKVFVLSFDYNKKNKKTPIDVLKGLGINKKFTGKKEDISGNIDNLLYK